MTYLDRGPVEIVQQGYADYGGLGPHVAISLSLEERTPLHISTTFGDCVHNLPSALDQHAWPLVVSSDVLPTASRPRTQFPIWTRCPRCCVCPRITKGANNSSASAYKCRQERV